MTKRKVTWIFIILAVLFVLPAATAHLLFKHGKGFLSERTTHRGELLDPVLSFQNLKIKDLNGQSIDLAKLKGKWQVLYIHDASECDKTCQDRLSSLRRIHLALGRENKRVVNWFIKVSPSIQKTSDQSAEQREYYKDGQVTPAMLESFFGDLPYSKNSGFYIVDPLGSLIMAYPEGVNPHNILKDLKRLLKVSQIG